MITKICENVWKLSCDSNIYFLNLDEKIIIDTGERAYRQRIEQFLKRIVDFDSVQKVIFTHLHYDHIGNFDLFPRAEFLASQIEIESLKNNPEGTVLDKEIVARFNVELNPIESFNGLKVVQTPGHTKGSICIWYPQGKILFSGDTMFDHKITGRTDLPTSAPEEMKNSLIKLLDYQFKILCPGHDY